MPCQFPRPIRSYVRHTRRMTLKQRKAYPSLWPHYGLETATQEKRLLDLPHLFGNTSPCLLEIGFGMGQSLFEMAQSKPDCNFLGVEVYEPGIGALLSKLEEAGIRNVRVLYDDAVSVLTYNLPPNSLHRIQIFFPDPWPKRKHRKRRLISPDFIELASSKLITGGQLHIATDWEDYAYPILELLKHSPSLTNQAKEGGFFTEETDRPPTKYEQRGKRLGHGVWDIVFVKA